MVATPGATVDREALLAYCRDHLASFKCPKTVDVVAELPPRNPTGKILKKDLRAPTGRAATGRPCEGDRPNLTRE